MRNFSFSKKATKAEGFWCEGCLDCNIDALESGRNDCKASLTQTLLGLNSEAVEDIFFLKIKSATRDQGREQEELTRQVKADAYWEKTMR